MKATIKNKSYKKMTMGTNKEIHTVFNHALQIFSEKMVNYGPAWLGFSPLGFADQIYIKANRYKTLVHAKQRKVADSPELELYAIINYCVLFLITRNRNTLIHIFNSPTAVLESPSKNTQKKLLAYYKHELKKTMELQNKKNHDYGSAWKSLSNEGLADIILTKTLRIKAMLSSGKAPCDDENPNGIAANLRDLINYSSFALVLSQ
jgi:hypothetical protein